MHPSGRELDSSDDEELHGKPQPPRQGPAGSNRFDKQHVISSVHKVQANMRSLLSTEDVALWGEWMECTPATLDEVHSSDRPLPLKMPMKCTAIRAAGDLVVLAPPPREQVELISFANPDGGREYREGQLKREALQARPLFESDIPVGTKVAVRRDGRDPWSPKGYGTLFYLGEVLALHFAASSDGGSSAGAQRPVMSLDVHYLLPMVGNREACDEEHKGWRPACCALHPWDNLCEKRHTCRDRRSPGAETSRLTARVDADTIFETMVELTATNLITAESKRRILQGASPEEQETWRTRLHINAGTAEAKARGEPRKQRVRTR